MDGQAILFALLLTFLIIPVGQAMKWHRLGQHTITWRDVRGLLAYFVVGFFVLRYLRGILL
ncbi:TPA: hypothetical protein N5L59_004452 [Enterobacter hormaechei subsp. steigerwaltii]|jgi:hypothetical protein|nr:hypothetical protein [Enterobacter hormaechei subsp. steigerwaltii]